MLTNAFSVEIFFTDEGNEIKANMFVNCVEFKRLPSLCGEAVTKIYE
jgi:hypothetical protein